MIKNIFYINKQKKILLLKKKKSFRLATKLQKLNSYRKLTEFSIIIILKSTKITYSKIFNLFLQNNNTQIHNLNKEMSLNRKYKFIQKNNNVFLYIKDIKDIKKIKKTLKENNYLIVGYWYNNILYNKKDLKIYYYLDLIVYLRYLLNKTIIKYKILYYYNLKLWQQLIKFL